MVTSASQLLHTSPTFAAQPAAVDMSPKHSQRVAATGSGADGPVCAHSREHDGGRTLRVAAKWRAVSGYPTDQTLFVRAEAERTHQSTREGVSCLRWEPAPGWVAHAKEILRGQP